MIDLAYMETEALSKRHMCFLAFYNSDPKKKNVKVEFKTPYPYCIICIPFFCDHGVYLISMRYRHSSHHAMLGSQQIEYCSPSSLSDMRKNPALASGNKLTPPFGSFIK